MTQLAETHSKLTRVGGGVGDRARGGATNPTVDPKSPYDPSLPKRHESLTCLQQGNLAQQFFAARAIDPAAARQVGVRFNGTELIYPNGRRRNLTGQRVKHLQPKGEVLAAWWLRGGDRTPVICEGESDALAALSALNDSPSIAGIRGLPVVALPGCSYPADRLIAELQGHKQAFLIFDADEAGWKASAKMADALGRKGIRPIPVELPEGMDLADWLRSISVEERGDRFANVLVDWQLAAPTIEEIRREHRIEALEAEAEKLKAQRAPEIRRLAATLFGGGA